MMAWARYELWKIYFVSIRRREATIVASKMIKRMYEREEKEIEFTINTYIIHNCYDLNGIDKIIAPHTYAICMQHKHMMYAFFFVVVKNIAHNLPVV